MIIYIVLVTTKQNQPFIAYAGNIKAVADQMCAIEQDSGLFAIVVEKKLNESTQGRKG